jgi:putative proteasome-type protease
MHEQSTNVNRMTYAVGVRLQRGLVFAADTRTNAGVDHVSQSRKLHFWRRTGDRVLVLLTAGNLAISQSVISIINEQLSPEAPTERPTLMNVSSMFRAARLIGDAMREVRTIDGPSLDKINTGFSVSCILGGQVGDEAPRLFQIYNEGNRGDRRHTVSPDRRAQIW